MTPVIDSDGFLYCVGGRTALGIGAPAPNLQASPLNNNASACFASARPDVDELHGFVVSLGAKISRAPREDSWAPGCYSLLFEDPDGISLEINHVPGKGLLA